MSKRRSSDKRSNSTGKRASVEAAREAVTTRPLHTVAELLAWKPPRRLAAAPRPLPKPGPVSWQQPVLMHAHDFKGGYKGDECAAGDASPDAVYLFQHWDMVDLFCYFSHHRVTIPPAAWIDVAHRHGTRVLGTFITEWDAGAQDLGVLLDKKNSETAAKNLWAIAQFYGFDGWLINIENPVADTDALHAWLRLLAQHRPDTTFTTIWYDSVTKDGALRWQNELNGANDKWYLATDAIFLNYHWNEACLQRSAKHARSHGRPSATVLAGVDVFGRGTFGGGGWDTPLAVRAAMQHALSSAVFAPGWTLECKPSGENTAFSKDEHRFWRAGIAPCITVQQRVPPGHILGLELTFCPGYGRSGLWWDGQRVATGDWAALALQSPALPYWHPDTPDAASIVEGQDAFRGSCYLSVCSTKHPITVLPSRPPELRHVFLAVRAGSAPIRVCDAETVLVQQRGSWLILRADIREDSGETGVTMHVAVNGVTVDVGAVQFGGAMPFPPAGLVLARHAETHAFQGVFAASNSVLPSDGLPL